MSVKIAGVPAEIRTEHLSITCLKRYPYDHPLGNDCSLRIKMQTQFLLLNSVCNWDAVKYINLLLVTTPVTGDGQWFTISLVKYFCVFR
jgi:hypothetical protein